MVIIVTVIFYKELRVALSRNVISEKKPLEEGTDGYNFHGRVERKSQTDLKKIIREKIASEKRKMAGKPLSRGTGLSAQSTDKDVGENMMRRWAKVSPEDKENFIKSLDEQILKAKGVLKLNPEDTEAKNELFMSETTKKLVMSGFDYRSIEAAIKGEEDFSKVQIKK